MSTQPQQQSFNSNDLLESTIPSSQESILTSIIVASSVSNMVGQFIGHPLDTVRVRMQLETKKISARHCIIQTIKNEGAMGLYKGVTQPMIGAVPINSIVFIATEICKRELNRLYPSMNPEIQAFAAGSFSAGCSLSVMTPIELLKCRAQVTKEGQLKYSQEIQAIIRQNGISGMYRGFWSSLWREIPGWGTYFFAYDYLKRISPFKNDQDKKRNLLWTMNAGGVAGVLSWACSIPQDIVKTMQQTHVEEKPLRFREAYSRIVSDGGIRNLYRGCGPTYLRTYSINVIILPMYDAILERMGNSQE